MTDDDIPDHLAKQIADINSLKAEMIAYSVMKEKCAKYLVEQSIVERLRELCCSCGEEAANYIEALESRRCATCKHYIKRYSYKEYECDNIGISDIMDDGDARSFTPSPDFGCTLWEAK